MAAKDLNIHQLVALAFNEAELGYLNKQPEFCATLERTKTADDLDALCEVGERLLEERDTNVT